MAYNVMRNHFAPKAMLGEGIDIEKNSHVIGWNKCNFRCAFCEQAASNFNNPGYFNTLSENEFISLVLKLIPYGSNFKFTGGEPTLNPNIFRDLQITCGLGGTVFLDTNGSNPEIVKKLLDNNLIRVLAVSLKGIQPEECLRVSRIKKKEMCWDNPLKTIEYGSKAPNVKVIVTHVCYNDVSYEELCKFADILEKYKGNVFYKINNLHKTVHLDDSLKRVDRSKIIEKLKKLIVDRPWWKGRIIFLDTDDACRDYEQIVFM